MPHDLHLPPPDTLLAPREVARLLGISSRSLERLIETGTFPLPIWIGGARRWQLESVQAHVAAAPRSRSRPRNEPPATEPQQPAQ